VLHHVCGLKWENAASGFLYMPDALDAKQQWQKTEKVIKL